MSNALRAATALGLALALAQCQSAPKGAPPAAEPITRVPLHGRFEVAFDAPGADFESLRARFVAPSGREVVVGAFPSRGRFKVRFAPAEAGEHRYTVTNGGLELVRGRFTCAGGRDPGYARRDPDSPHHLKLEDGTPFLPLGENRINVYDPSWNYEHLGLRAYVRRMGQYGMNTLRVFIVSDVESEEHPDAGNPPGVIEPTLGRFDDKVAEDFDEIFSTAEESGVYVVLTVFALGFSQDDPWKSWQDNPYSAERGGPAKDRFAFFSDQAARRAETRRLKYLANRYGYSTHLLAVDLLNEPEWDGAIPEPTWIPWAEDMAARWRELDPYGHLVTAGSVGLHWNIGGDERPWYASPRNDLVEWHLYGKEIYEVHALAAEMARKVGETWGYGKPVLVGEFAYGGEPKPAYDHTLVGIWSATFAGAGALAHSAPPFNLDSDEFMTPERAHHFAVLSAFLKRIAPRHPLEPLPGAATGTPEGLRVQVLGGEDVRALWLLAPLAGYGEPVTGAKVQLSGLRPGRYRVEWFDDVTGERRSASELKADGGPATLAPPPFVRHLAGTVTPLAP